MTKTLKKAGKQPRPGSRFPSQILGDNVKEARMLRGLKQTDLLERLKEFGIVWKQVTLSELERGVRPTSVDELFALALALSVPVIKLLDPYGVAGVRRTGVDVGFNRHADEGDETVDAQTARYYILPEGDDPWKIDSSHGYAWEGNTIKVVHWERQGDTIRIVQP